MGDLIQFLVVAAVVIGGGIWLKRAVQRKAEEETRSVPPPRSDSPARADPSVPPTFGRAKRRPLAPQSETAIDMDAVAAQWRQQAKEKDDRHKAELRAHVERAAPPASDEGREAIERSQKAWIAIRHVFPPRLPQRSMSYLGGLPIVPDEFDWPTVHNREGLLERLNFVAQIDCADLPEGDNRDLLPKSGYLYFFAPLSGTFGTDASHFVCRYEKGPVTKKWEPLDMPFTGKIESDDRIEIAWRGKRTHFDKAEVEFGWIAEPSDPEVAARGAEGHAFEVAAVLEKEKEEAFFGPTGEADAMFMRSSAPRDAVWIPYQGFPINWKTVRIIEQLVRSYYREEVADVEERLEKLGAVPEDDPEAQRLKALKSELTMFSMKISSPFFHNMTLKDHEAVPEEKKAQVLAFLEQLRVDGMPSSKDRRYDHLSLPAIVNDWVAAAAVHGAEAGLLDKEGAELIPAEVVAALAERHKARTHRLLGKGTLVQVAAEDMKESHILLLQLGPDPALNWTVGEMGPMQYWIRPEDLAAKRFENAVLTIEAY